jgi:PAS domain S-box-containing protein
VSTDVSPHAIQARHAAFLSRLSRDLSRIADAGEMIRHACRAVGEHLHTHRVYFAEVNEAADTITVNGDWTLDGTLTVIGSYRMSDLGTPEFWHGLQARRLGIDDVTRHPLTRGRLDVLNAFSIRAFANTTYVREGQWLVHLAVNEPAPRQWREDELALLESVVARVWPLVEQARTQQALRERETSWHSALSAARLGTYDWDLRTNQITWNEAQHQIFGTDPVTDAPSIDTAWARIHPEDRERLQGLLDGALASGQSYESEFRILLPDGQVKWCVGGTAVVLDGQRRPVRVSGVSYDITGQKQIEQVLRESRDVLALAMSGGRMGVWSRNLSTGVVWWSREVEEIFGLEPGAFEGTEEGFLSYVHSDDREGLRQAVAHALATCTDYVGEFRFRHASGEWRWMDTRGRAVYDSHGRPETLYGIGIDITERKRTEESLAAARDAAESANRIKDQFMATLSHELRTPLNAILGYARMLRTNALPIEKRARAVEIIERNAIVQNQLVEDLLDISRIGTGKVRLDVEPLVVAAPLREAIESVRPAAEAKRITLQVQVAARGTVRGDAGRLQQVFWNLLSNAVKFTPDGGQVTVSLSESDGSVHVGVKDTGAGIPRDFLPYVFEPFLQADGRFSREHGGLGLGLAICKQLVQLHGGTISATSDGTGKGAIFTVNLPLAADLVSPAAPGMSPDPRLDAHTAATPAPPPLRLDDLDVLIVDDEEDTRDLFRQALENAGAAVRAVASAPDALREFDARAPHILVTDLGLPRVDGYELLRHVRSRSPEHGGAVTAISVTAYARLNDRTQALAAGFDAHVAKPIAPDDLVAAIRSAVRPKV